MAADTREKSIFPTLNCAKTNTAATRAPSSVAICADCTASTSRTGFATNFR